MLAPVGYFLGVPGPGRGSLSALIALISMSVYWLHAAKRGCVRPADCKHIVNFSKGALSTNQNESCKSPL